MAMSNNNTNGFKQKKSVKLWILRHEHSHWHYLHDKIIIEGTVWEKNIHLHAHQKNGAWSRRDKHSHKCIWAPFFFLLLHTNRKQGNWVCEHAERNVFTLMLLWIKHCHVIAVGQLLRKCISTPVWFTFDCWENANHADTIACWIKSVWGDA